MRADGRFYHVVDPDAPLKLSLKDVVRTDDDIIELVLVSGGLNAWARSASPYLDLLQHHHPGFTISDQASQMLDSMLFDNLQPVLCRTALRLLNHNHPDTPPGELLMLLTPQHMLGAVRLVLPGALAQQAATDGIKVVADFSNAPSGTYLDESSAVAADGTRMHFSVRKTAWKVWTCFSQRWRAWALHTFPGEAATLESDCPHKNVIWTAVFLTAVLQYMTTEILDLAASCARDFQRNCIAPRHLMYAIHNDQELCALFDKRAKQGIAGGVVPHLHPNLLDIHTKGSWNPATGAWVPAAPKPDIKLKTILEECSLETSQKQQTAGFVVDSITAWRLARKAGVKRFNISDIVPMLEEITQKLVNSCVHCAASAAGSGVVVDSDHMNSAVGLVAGGLVATHETHCSSDNVYQFGSRNQTNTDPFDSQLCKVQDEEKTESEDSYDGSCSSDYYDSSDEERPPKLQPPGPTGFYSPMSDDLSASEQDPLPEIGGYSAGRLALDRVRKEQQLAEPVLHFGRLSAVVVRALDPIAETGLITGRAISCLLLYVEDLIVDLLRHSNLCAIEAERTCVEPSDISLILYMLSASQRWQPLVSVLGGAELPTAEITVELGEDDDCDLIMPEACSAEAEDVSSGVFTDDATSRKTLDNLEHVVGLCNTSDQAQTAARDICYGTSTNWHCCPVPALERVVCNCGEEIMPELTFAPCAAQAIQIAVEAHCQDVFQAACASAHCAGRAQIWPKDIQRTYRVHRLDM